MLAESGQSARSPQEAVNHVGGTGASYGALTSEIKRIPTGLRHTPHIDRTDKKSSAGSVF
jgi:hypothetical protein